VGISVYREPVDRNAPPLSASPTSWPVRVSPLTAPWTSPASRHPCGELLAPHLQELDRLPVPPFTEPPGLAGQLAACLLHADQDGQDQRFFVHRWTRPSYRPVQQARGPSRTRTAALLSTGGGASVSGPRTGPLTCMTCSRPATTCCKPGTLRMPPGHRTGLFPASRLGAWDQEASLIYDTLTRLPADSPRQPAWIHQLGMPTQRRGDHDEAARQYQRARGPQQVLRPLPPTRPGGGHYRPGEPGRRRRHRRRSPAGDVAGHPGGLVFAWDAGFQHCGEGCGGDAVRLLFLQGGGVMRPKVRSAWR